MNSIFEFFLLYFVHIHFTCIGSMHDERKFSRRKSTFSLSLLLSSNDQLINFVHILFAVFFHAKWSQCGAEFEKSKDVYFKLETKLTITECKRWIYVLRSPLHLVAAPKEYEFKIETKPNLCCIDQLDYYYLKSVQCSLFNLHQWIKASE